MESGTWTSWSCAYDNNPVSHHTLINKLEVIRVFTLHSSIEEFSISMRNETKLDFLLCLLRIDFTCTQIDLSALNISFIMILSEMKQTSEFFCVWFAYGLRLDAWFKNTWSSPFKSKSKSYVPNPVHIRIFENPNLNFEDRLRGLSTVAASMIHRSEKVKW